MDKGFLASLSSGQPGRQWTPMVLAVVLFATVLLPGLIGVALMAQREMVRQVDRQINEEGVRTVSLLCLLEPDLVGEPGRRTIVGEIDAAGDMLREVEGELQFLRSALPECEYETYHQEAAVDGEEPATPMNYCNGHLAQSRRAWANLFATPAIRGTLPKGTGVVNVMMMDAWGQPMWMYDTSSPEIRLAGRTAIATDRGVTIYEGRYKTTRTMRVREFVGRMVDKTGKPVGEMRLFLSAARIDEVKDRFLSAVLLPMGLSALAGLGITVLLTYGVMSRLKRKAQAPSEEAA